MQETFYDKSYPWLVASIAALVAAGGWLTNVYTGPNLWMVWVGTLLLAALAAYIPISRDQKREKTIEQVRRESNVIINDAFGPLVNAVGQVAGARNSKDRNAAVGNVYALAVAATAGLNNATRARSSLYFVVDASGRWKLPKPKWNSGRVDVARTEFIEGTVAGDAVRKMLDDDGALFCEDTEIDPPAGWDPSIPRNYRTFISVAVTFRGRGVGMLTVNALEPGDLSVDDVATTQVIASLVGTTYGLRKVAQ